MASSNDDRFHWHFTAGESTDSSISSMASATYSVTGVGAWSASFPGPRPAFVASGNHTACDRKLGEAWE